MESRCAVTLVVIVLCLLYLLPAVTALAQLRDRRLGDAATAVWALCIVLAPLFGSLAFWFVNPKPTGRLDELMKAFNQFRGSVSDIIGAQQDAVEVSRDRTEEEAARAFIQQERPS
jgi:hypothetical protein